MIFDQFEDYFKYHAEGDEAFERDLARLINRRDLDAHVLIAIREDAFFQLSRLQPRIPFITVNALRLDHLDEVAARQVIEEPLKVFNKKHGTSWEPDPDLVRQLIEKVYVKEARSPTMAADRGDRPRQVELPLLQLALVELWDEESKAGSHRLRLETLVKQLGDVEGILDRYVQKGLDGLDPVQQEVCARLLDRLVTPTGMRAAFRLADLEHYAAPEGEPSDLPEGSVRQVVDHLDRERLLRPVPDPRHPEQPLYEVFHDVLAEPLREWQSWRQLVARARQLLARARKALEDDNARHAQLLALEWPVQEMLGTHTDLADDLRSILAAALHPPIAFSLLEHRGAVTAIAFTPDGRRIVSGGQDRRVLLWDATTGKATGGLPDHERRVLALAVSPDGRRIATGAADGIVRLWDAASQRPVGRLEAHEGPASALAYGTHDRLVSGSWDGTAIVWDALVRRPAQRLVGHAAPIAAVACSPDGEVVATASDDGTARLWHAPSGTERRRLEGHGGPVYAAAFDAAGRRLATGGADGVVRLWNAATGELEQELSGHQEAVRCLAFLPDGELLASGSLDGTVRLWDLAPDGPSPRTLSAGRAMRAIAVSPDGRRLAAGTGDGRVLVWRLLPRDLEGLLAHAAELRLEPLSEEERRQFGLSPSSIGQRQAPG